MYVCGIERVQYDADLSRYSATPMMEIGIILPDGDRLQFMISTYSIYEDCGCQRVKGHRNSVS